jgi:putative ABC transport system permease protein
MFRRRKRTSEDFRQEIEAHLVVETDRLMAEGLTAEQARAAARRSFGNVTHVRERFYESGRVMWLHDASRDLRYALRSLFRNPSFSLVVLLTLALGIGSTTAIFTVVHALLLKPLPYPESDRLVRLILNQPPGQSTSAGPRRIAGGISVRELAELRSRMKSISKIGVYGPALMTMIDGTEASRPEGMRISASIWQAIGAKPLLGRVFTDTEEAPGADPVIVLSNTFWRRFFHGDPNVLGRTLILEDNILLMLGNKKFAMGYTVVGVMPEGFEFPDSQPQFWIPVALSPSAGGAVLAHLAEGVSQQAASAEVNAILHELRPKARSTTFELSREQDEVVGPVRDPLHMLMGAVGLVLLVASVNVANLLLARGVARQREIAIRLALGSGRGRLIRQFLTESAILSLLGGAGGVALAYGGVQTLKNLASTLSRMDLGNRLPFPRLNEVGIDAVVLLFALGISLGTSLVFGLAPLIGRGASSQSEALKEGTVASSGTVGRRWGTGSRSALVIAEIAMAMMLLVGAGLLIRSFLKLSSVDPGYDPSGVLTFQLALPGGRYPVPQIKELAEQLVAQLEKMPGVQAAAYAHQLPMVSLRQSAAFRISPALPERPLPGPSAEDARFVSRDYFKALGIKIKAGRGFDEHDRTGQPRVLVLNETLVRREFPSRDPIGQIAYLGRDSEPWRIVGVVQDVRQFGFDRQPDPQVFADFRQWPGVSPIGDVPQYYAVRTQGDPFSVVPAIRNALNAIDPQAGLYNVASLEQLVSNSMSRPRLYTVLLGIFAGVSVTLAGIGIYGLTAYSVVRRTREIGIRMALGAPRSQVLGLVLRQSMGLAVVGIGLGCAGATTMTRFLEGMLFAIKPFDGATLLSVILLFLLVAGLATYAPARRATKVDPVVALRCE